MNWKTISYLCLFLLAFLDPFFINIPVGPLRVTAIRMVIAGVLILLVYRHLFKGEPLKEGILGYPFLFLVVWFIYGLMSLGWTTNKSIGIKELYYFSTFIVYIFLLIQLLQTKNQVFWINQSFWGIGIITIVICLLELITNHHLSTSRYVIESVRFSKDSTRVATAFFYNENDLSLFLVMVAPFFFIKWLKSSVIGKVINTLFILAIFVIVDANSARLAFFSLLIQFVLLVYFVKRKWFFRGFRLLLLVSPILIGASWYLLGNDFDTLFDVKGFENGYGSGFIRLNLYLNGIYSLFQSHMLGVGPGNYQEHMYPFFNTKGIVNPHNWWIEILTNYGLLIFVGYLFFFGYLLRKTYRIYRHNPEENHLGLTLFLCFVGFAIACIGPSRLFYFWPMWILIGVSLAYINSRKAELAKSEFHVHPTLAFERNHQE